MVGDTWDIGGGGPVVITKFESLEEEGYPWPMVHYTLAGWTAEGHTGAPAFVFGELVSRGAGVSWEPEQRKEQGE